MIINETKQLFQFSGRTEERFHFNLRFCSYSATALSELHDNITLSIVLIGKNIGCYILPKLSIISKGWRIIDQVTLQYAVADGLRNDAEEASR